LAQKIDALMTAVWTISEDLKTVTLTVPGNPPIALRFTVADVDDILKNLGGLRALMKPEFPRDYAGGQKVRCITDPIWASESDVLMGNSLLHIRDPRYGWLHYMLPKNEARKLGGYLLRLADKPAPGPSTGKAN
jgi:hypothetical protein